MIPLLFRLEFDGALSQVLAYAAAALLVAYTGFAGWRGARHARERPRRMAIYLAVGAALAAFALRHALPASAFPGGQGQGLPVHAYGLLLTLGLVSAVAVAAELARREWGGEEGERKREQVIDLAVWVALSGFAGARLLFVAVNWESYAKAPERLFALEGGLVFHGGLLGAMAASFVFTRVHRIDFLRLGDVGIVTVSLGQFFGRLGCFTAGCCWGDVTAQGSAFGVHFPGAGLARDLFGRLSHTPSLAAVSQLEDGRWVVPATGEVFAQPVDGAVRISDWVIQRGHTLPVHPTQLYEALGQLAIFLIGLAVLRHRRFRGQLLGAWLIAYAALRGAVELFRGDAERGTLHGLLRSVGSGLAEAVPPEAWFNVSTGQAISLCLFGLGAAILWHGARVSGVGKGAPEAPAVAFGTGVDPRADR